MTKFKVGDLIKRPAGKMIYEVLSVNARSRFGNLYVANNNTGKKYFFTKKVASRFNLYEPMKPIMDSKEMKFDFKHGV